MLEKSENQQKFIFEDLELEIRDDSWDDSVLKGEIMADMYEVYYPKVAVDIGAHIGGTSIVCASRGAFVYAFEPSVINYNQLLKNIELNRFSDSIIARNVGIGNPGKRKLYHHPYNYGCFSFNQDNVKGMNDDGEEVEIISIKDVFKDIEYCDFLKIDCEGAEVEFYRDLPVEKIGRISIELHERSEDKDIIEFLSKYYNIRNKEHLYICNKKI